MKIKVPADGKLYSTKSDRSIYLTTSFLAFLWISALIIFIQEIMKEHPNALGIFLLSGGLLFIGYFIWHAFAIAVSAVLTEKAVVGYNAYNRRLGEMYFDDIEEIYIMWKFTYDVVLKSKRGKKLVINAAAKPAEDLFNTILQKAINCYHVSIEKAKDFAPNLTYYKK